MHLEGHPQGCLSNACGAYVRAVVTANSLSSTFGVYFGADDVSKAKPAPDGLLYCAQELHVSQARCIYVGDSPSDGLAAKNAGMVGIGVLWGSNKRGKLVGCFDHIAANVEELQALIRSSRAEMM